MNFYRIVFFFVVSLLSPAILPATGFAQSGNVWGVTPVFDGGRVMPLHTFSRQIVREICGSERPFIVRDDSILTQLSQMFAARPTEIQAEQGSQYPFLVPGTDVFGETNAGFAVPTHPVETESDGPALASLNFNLNRAEMERILQRVRALVPQRGRYFDADELVLSWLGEPEIWEFIPIFSVSENDFRTEVLGIPLENDSRTALNRVSVFQLENSVRYQHRLVDMARRQSHRVEPSVDIPFDRVAARLDEALKTYQELTYHPARQRPRRMLDLLSGTVDARAGREAPFISALESWAYLLSVGDVPERQTVDFHLANEKLAPSLHPTTQRWHAILQQIQLLHGAFLRENAQGKMEVPNLWAVERLFETIIQSIDLNLEESAALMERIYPGTAFRKDNSVTDVGTLLPLLFSATSAKQNEESVSRIILNYHYSIKKLRREIMAAYLALYDNGKSLRVVPLGSELALGGPENSQSGVQPWGTMQMLLYGGDAFVRRFFDPQFQLDVAAARPAWLLQTPVADDPASETVSEESTDEGEPMSEENALERDLFARDDSSAVNAVSRSPADLLALGPVGNVRGHFRNLATAYTMLTQEYARTRLDGAASDLQRALRETAGRSNAIRLEFLDDDHVATNEFIAKTGYPGENPMLAEYRYYRLAPFFWMWIFAACALVMACFSYVLGRVRHEQTARSEEETALLGTRSDFFRPEEWLLWGGILFIVLSSAVTFLGGVQRAWISGWAPVTNMYETIVLMAFSASLFGLWYVLAPLIHPPLIMAWRYTSFPTWERIRHFWLSAKAVVPLPATQGEQAIREAAELFGATGGSQITSQQNSHEAQSRSTFSWQVGFFVPRILLMFLTFFAVVHLAYGEYAHEHGAFAAAAQMLKLSDFIDWIVVVASVALIVWGVPHLLLTFILFPILLAWPSRIAAVFRVEPVSAHEELRIGQGRNTMRSVLSGEGSELHAASSPGRHWLSLARNEIMDRSLFILISAAIALLAGLAAHFNSTQFNPDIRPIAAVLRSNFWLTVHVIAIIVSYAAAMIAWGMAVVALGAVIFGRYRYSESPDGRQRIALPPLMEMMSPIIDKLLHLAMLLLILGTVLGARWADYSWGRFWSWDPKEVWALITILFYAIVIHGRVARFYGIIGVTVGALFGSIAVIFTWYGINFMFKGSVHSYGGGAGGQATLFMMTFIGLNILWGSLALFRYNAVMFGRDGDDNGL